MKALKKTLSLVLALALVFGLCTVAFAESNLDGYTDAEDVTYVEAVDTLIGLGIVNGMTDTTIVPQGNYTREQAAVLMCRILLSEDLLDLLVAENDPFTDVKASRWSAGAIAYCVGQGIINGRGDGTFDPTGLITNVGMAKLLCTTLAAAGVIDVEEDRYVGTGWEVNAAMDAFEIGVFEGFEDLNLTAAATREEAMQSVFNVLLALEAIVKVDDLVDEYGYSSYGYALEEPEASAEPELVSDEYPVDVEIDTVVAPAEQEEGVLAESYKSVLNGVGADESYVDGDTVILLNADEDGAATKIIVLHEVLSTVDSVDEEADEETGLFTYKLADGTEIEDVADVYEADDYVLYLKSWNGSVIEHQAAPYVEGKLTAIPADENKLEIDGEEYNSRIGAPTAGDAVDYEGTYKFYVNSNDFILACAPVVPEEETPEEHETEKVYVIALQGKVDTTNEVPGDLFQGAVEGTSSYAAKAQILHMDGSIEIIDLAVGTDPENEEDETIYASGVAVTDGDFMNAKGCLADIYETEAGYVIANADALVAASQITVAKGNRVVGDETATSATELVVITVDDMDEITTAEAASYVGYSNFIDAEGVGYMVKDDVSKKLVTVYVIVEAAEEEPEEPDAPVAVDGVLVSFSYEKTTAKGELRNCYLNGAPVQYYVKPGVDLYPGYYHVKVDAEDPTLIVEAEPLDEEIVASGVTITYIDAGYYFDYEGGSIELIDGFVVYEISDTGIAAGELVVDAACDVIVIEGETEEDADTMIIFTWDLDEEAE